MTKIKKLFSGLFAMIFALVLGIGGMGVKNAKADISDDFDVDDCVVDFVWDFIGRVGEDSVSNGCVIVDRQLVSGSAFQNSLFFSAMRNYNSQNDNTNYFVERYTPTGIEFKHYLGDTWVDSTQEMEVDAAETWAGSVVGDGSTIYALLVWSPSSSLYSFLLNMQQSIELQGRGITVEVYAIIRDPIIYSEGGLNVFCWQGPGEGFLLNNVLYSE